ncbi:MICOS complex subunit MIC13 isoform X1 [Pteropus vampyrus]|uniref:MICOS complex subunit MIC13 n=1 Tax=Pteropus vampyrus TaxID=132908 RepID=A0A6P6D552_PTEVA|nr:MICOS complex subunit MIC13 isoform X1 [Pteropus vampyrus]
MRSRVWPLMRFLIKGSVAGGVVYLVYDQQLLGPSDKSQAALQKAEEVVPQAMYQFSQYVCEQTGLKIPQLPAPPKFNFHVHESWNSVSLPGIDRAGSSTFKSTTESGVPVVGLNSFALGGEPHQALGPPSPQASLR